MSGVGRTGSVGATSRMRTPRSAAAPTLQLLSTPAQARGVAGDWVNTLATTVLVLTLLYLVFGVPGDDPTQTAQTDRVNPLNRWIWIGLLMTAVPVLLRHWRDVIALARSNWPLTVLMAYFALSTTWALDSGASTRRMFLTLVQMILAATLVSGVRRTPVLHVAIASVCAFSAMADLTYLTISPGKAMDVDGFAGLQGQKNQAGLLLMYGCLAAVPCLFLLRRWWSRGLLLVPICVMLLLLLLTRSTTSQSVVFGAALMIPILRLVARLPRKLIWSIGAAAVCLPVTLLFLYLVWCGFSDADPLAPVRGATFSERTDIWSFVIDEIAKRPWFGAGYESFWAIDPGVQPSLKTDQWFGVYAIINEGHDGYLDLLATGGIVGLILALFVLARTILLAGRAVTRTAASAEAWRANLLAHPTAIFYLAFLLGLVVHNGTESNLFSNNSVLSFGLLLCALDLEKWWLQTTPVRAAPLRQVRRRA